MGRQNEAIKNMVLRLKLHRRALDVCPPQCVPERLRPEIDGCCREGGSGAGTVINRKSRGKGMKMG